MRTQNNSVQQIKVLDELIDNAIDLPLDSQDMLLMLAKAMRRTRDCIIGQDAVQQPRKPPENYTE